MAWSNFTFRDTNGEETLNSEEMSRSLSCYSRGWSFSVGSIYLFLFWCYICKSPGSHGLEAKC